MSLSKSALFNEARQLPPVERATLVENLLESFGIYRQRNVDEAWAAEAESRIDAYKAGKLDEIPISKVFGEIERGGEYKGSWECLMLHVKSYSKRSSTDVSV